MKILSIVNKISKTSVPFQWNLLFCARKDGNSYFIYGFGLKALVSIFRSDLIHTHHIKSGCIFTLFSKILRKKTIFTLHGSISNASTLNKILFSIILIFTDKLVLVSPSLLNAVKLFKVSKYFDIDIEVIPNGIDLNIKSISNELILDKFNIDKSAKIILHPARFVVEKNHIRLLQAMKIVKDKCSDNIILVLCGNGELHDKIKDEVAINNLQNIVFFTNLIPREDVISLLDKCELYVMPSISEGLNVSFLEALAKTKKILVSNIVSFNSFFDSNKLLVSDLNAYLVDPYSVDEIAEGIIFQLNSKIVNDFDKNFIDIKKMIDSYSNLYEKLDQNL